MDGDPDVPTAAPGRIRLRSARAEDYDRIAAVVDDWWGRPILGVLPRLFLDHFHATSLIAEDGPGRGADDGVDDGVDDGQRLAGFLVGFLSPSEPDQAYIHFVGVAPRCRGLGLGRTLYERFFALARESGRSRVGAVTSPVNEPSIAFHRAMGFEVAGPFPDHGGPGHPLMSFTRRL